MRVIEPVVSGWMAFEGTEDFSNLTNYNVTFRDNARKFENVTLPFQDFAGMVESLSLLMDLGLEQIAAYLDLLRKPLLRAGETGRVQVVSSTRPGTTSAIICVTNDRLAESYLRLKAGNVVCSLREGMIRLSPHCYNTPEEMERVASILVEE